MATTAQRIKEAMEKRNIKQIELSEKTGIGKSSISTYLSGAYVPKQRNLYKIAKALEVSEAWLMGLDVPMNSNKWDNIRQSMNETKAFEAELEALGWKCELISCSAWEEVEMGVHEGTPIGCTLPDNVRRDCNSCYMKQPKYVFSNGTTSFEVSMEDYSAFIKDNKAFFMQRIQALMLKSSDILFNDIIIHAPCVPSSEDNAKKAEQEKDSTQKTNIVKFTDIKEAKKYLEGQQISAFATSDITDAKILEIANAIYNSKNK